MFLFFVSSRSDPSPPCCLFFWSVAKQTNLVLVKNLKTLQPWKPLEKSR